MWYKKFFTLSIKEVFLRFPGPLLASWIAVSTWTYVTIVDPEQYQAIFTSTILTSLLGITWLTGIVLYGLRRGASWKWRTIAQLVGVIPLIGFFISSLPSDLNIEFYEPTMILFVLMFLASFSFVMTAPFIKHANEIGFWQFNKWLLLRIFLAAFSGIILFGAFSLAIFSVDTLFDINIDGDWYLILWQWIVLGYGVMFVLLGMKPDLNEYDKDAQYPSIIRKFTTYILSPIMLVYATIIYAYLAKILIIERVIPEGGLAMPVSLYTVAVLLAMLLTYPWNFIIKKHQNLNVLPILMYSLLPVLPMYFWALSIRISQYGFTTPRYLGVVTGIWFVCALGIALLTKYRKISWMFIVSAVLLVLISYGPYSVFNVSKKSQTNQFIQILHSEGVVKNQELDTVRFEEWKKEREFEYDDENSYHRASNIVYYLNRNHALDLVQKEIPHLDTKTIQELFNIWPSVPHAKQEWLQFYAQFSAYEIKAEDNQTMVLLKSHGPTQNHVTINESSELQILYKNNTYLFDMSSYENTWKIGEPREFLEHQKPVILTSSEDSSVKLIIQSLSGWKSDGQWNDVVLDGLLLLSE